MTDPNRCAICGLFIHEAHPVSVQIDHRIVANLQVCIEHREKLRDAVDEWKSPPVVRESGPIRYTDYETPRERAAREAA